MTHDDVDKRLINALIKDPRKSYRQLAHESKVSVATISNRLKELSKKQILKDYTSIVDYDKLGYEIHVMVNIRVSKSKELFVAEKLNSPNVTAIYDITGDFDLMVIARFKNRRALDNYVKKIQTYEFIERTQTLLILNTIKEHPIEVE
ncbi:MAG: Lrp/AsnC family transcriptional regulator [Candidatus Pacearchaeota archaeon]|jgi:Lrp/AsnC family transcriptional regulator for asnA, asnC and gidA